MVQAIIKMLVIRNRRASERLLKRGDAARMRAHMERALGNPLIRVRCRTERARGCPVPAEWVTRGRPGPVVMYLHGGGYVVGSPGTHRPLVASILKKTGGRALVIDYRLAPECAFPAQRDDACAAYRWLLDGGVAPASIAVMGDSAGGGLLLAMVQELRRTGLPLPSCCIGLSPWTDVSLSGATMREKAAVDVMLTEEMMTYYSRAVAGARDISDPGLSPLFGEMQGLPPFLIQVGTDEMLLDDSRRLATRLRRAGVPVAFEEYRAMFHGFHMFSRFLGQARGAVDRIGLFVRSCARHG